MKNRPDISLIITIGTILLSLGGSYGVMTLKANEVDKVKEKTQEVSDKVIALETKLDTISESMKEQRSDIKEILKELKK